MAYRTFFCDARIAGSTRFSTRTTSGIVKSSTASTPNCDQAQHTTSRPSNCRPILSNSFILPFVTRDDFGQVTMLWAKIAEALTEVPADKRVAVAVTVREALRAIDVLWAAD